jgi:hypothetical protein
LVWFDTIEFGAAAIESFGVDLRTPTFHQRFTVSAIPRRKVRWYRPVLTLIRKTFFCEMSKCEVLKRHLNEVGDFFAGKTETKQNEMTVITTLL